jgi:hypothetical protein
VEVVMSDEIREAIEAVRGALRGPPVCPICGSHTREEHHASGPSQPESWSYHCTNGAKVDGSGCGFEWGLGGEVLARECVEDGIPMALRSALTRLLTAWDQPSAPPEARALRAGWTRDRAGGEWRGGDGSLELSWDGRTGRWIHLWTNQCYYGVDAALTAALDYVGVPR